MINKKIKKNQHIRFKGSDYKKGDLLIKKGTILQSNHILALKSLGVDSINVRKKPNILFLLSPIIGVLSFTFSNSFELKSSEVATTSMFFISFNGVILKISPVEDIS